MTDAIVIGAGPNGLVAANLLADEGWSVLVLEEQAEAGGAVKSAEVAADGYTHDLFSALPARCCLASFKSIIFSIRVIFSLGLMISGRMK